MGAQYFTCCEVSVCAFGQICPEVTIFGFPNALFSVMSMCACVHVCMCAGVCVHVYDVCICVCVCVMKSSALKSSAVK